MSLRIKVLGRALFTTDPELRSFVEKMNQLNPIPPGLINDFDEKFPGLRTALVEAAKSLAMDRLEAATFVYQGGVVTAYTSDDYGNRPGKAIAWPRAEGSK